MDPTVIMLAECLEEQKNANNADFYTEKRLSDMKEFFDSTSACYDKLNSLPTSTLRKLSKMGDKLLKLLSI
jgi:hypothetical protein